MRTVVLLTLLFALSAAAQKEIDDAALDRECAQKDCRYSRLHWFTDFEAAKAEAQRTGKPIISLRLLGRLDEEVSCANSRFFRTILYPDPSIAPLMRERFVLHWKSVRSVPKITIDLGDGRTIRQTITGNSAHYLLDENGRVLDVLPGMVSPASFRAQLEEWTSLNASSDLKEYHGRAIRKRMETRSRFMTVLAFPEPQAPTAKEAAARAMTKAVIEVPVLKALDPKASLRELPQPAWDSIGDSMKAEVAFSAPSLELMRKKQPVTEAMLDQLRATIAADTMLNQEELHYRIHEWFLSDQVHDVESLNQRVYAELFLTPLDDPWMGLKPPAAFAALAE
jgi:hypothetical protein